MYYIVIPTHNRLQTTLNCIRSLNQNNVFDWAKVIVVDDASSDGTSSLISREWKNIIILEGNGNLWWGGAMRKGMEYAFAQTDCSGIIWLNDDCIPEKETLRIIADKADSIHGIAVAESTATNGVIYAGFKKNLFGLRFVKSSHKDIRIDSFSGNCVAIHRSVVDKIGFVDSFNLPHHYADTDYGLKASSAGIPVFLCAEARCNNAPNNNLGMKSWLSDPTPTEDILKSFESLKSMMHKRSRVYFYTMHWGISGYVRCIYDMLRFVSFRIIHDKVIKKPIKSNSK